MGRDFLRYLPLDQRAVEWQIYCTDAGCNHIPAGAVYPPRADQHPPAYSRSVTSHRTLNEFQIAYITRGRGVFRCGPDQLHRITAGTVFLMFPGVWHAFSPDPETGWDEYWVGFDGAYARTIWEKGFISLDHPVHEIGLWDDVLEKYHAAFDIADRELPGFQLRLSAVILDILTRILSVSYSKRQQSGTEAIVKRAKFHMEEHLSGELELPTLLAQLNMGYSAFLKLFKGYTGLSPHQYFLQLKINRAKQLISGGRVTVKEVAFSLGFKDQYYFSRLFKRKTGLAPVDWQSTNRRPSSPEQTPPLIADGR